MQICLEFLGGAARRAAPGVKPSGQGQGEGEDSDAARQGECGSLI